MRKLAVLLATIALAAGLTMAPAQASQVHPAGHGDGWCC